MNLLALDEELTQDCKPTTLCCAYLLSHVQLFVTPWTIARQAPLSIGILQARILDWVAMPSSRGTSRPTNQTSVSCTAGRFFTSWATQEAGGSDGKEINYTSMKKVFFTL